MITCRRNFHAFPILNAYKLLVNSYLVFLYLRTRPFFFGLSWFVDSLFFWSVGVVIGRVRRLLQRRRVRVPICRRWRAVFLCCRGALRESRWRILRWELEERVSLAAQWRGRFWDIFFARCGFMEKKRENGKCCNSHSTMASTGQLSWQKPQ